MTDGQIIAIAITVLAVLGGTLVNNSRISDLNSSLSNRIGDVKEVLRAELNAHRAETDARFMAMTASIDARFNSIDRKLDEILRIAGDHDSRIGRLEERLK
jgi:archaellum component FlaC